MIPGFCQAPGCDRELPAKRRRFCSDLCRRRGQRAERITETEEFGQAALRMITALASRVHASDLDVLGALWEVRLAADRAAVDAIDGLRAKGYPWAALAAEVGMPRQGLTQWRARRSGPFEGNETLRSKPRSPGGGHD